MTTPSTNGVSLSDLIAAAAQLGGENGKGRDTQIKMGIMLVEGGYHSGIDLEANKHGTDIDDATKIAEAYVKAQSGAVVFDAKAPNQRKLISTFRTCIKLGMWPKGGNGEPLATVNQMISDRQKLRAIPAEAKKLDDAFNALLKYARAQIKADQLLSPAEITSFLYKSINPLKTAEEVVEAQRDALQKLYEGKAANGTAQDHSPQIKAAIDALTKRLKEIATARAPAQGAVTSV